MLGCWLCSRRRHRRRRLFGIALCLVSVFIYSSCSCEGIEDVRPAMTSVLGAWLYQRWNVRGAVKGMLTMMVK